VSNLKLTINAPDSSSRDTATFIDARDIERALSRREIERRIERRKLASALRDPFGDALADTEIEQLICTH